MSILSWAPFQFSTCRCGTHPPPRAEKPPSWAIDARNGSRRRERNATGDLVDRALSAHVRYVDLVATIAILPDGLSRIRPSI